VSNVALDWTQAENDMTGGLDITVPHSARVWDHWLGGKDHYETDRQAAGKVQAAFPGIAASVRQLRHFTIRVVRYLAAETGIRQFRMSHSASMVDIFISTGFGFPVTSRYTWLRSKSILRSASFRARSVVWNTPRIAISSRSFQSYSGPVTGPTAALARGSEGDRRTWRRAG